MVEWPMDGLHRIVSHYLDFGRCHMDRYLQFVYRTTFQTKIIFIDELLILIAGGVFPNGVPGIGRNSATNHQRNEIDGLVDLIWPALLKWGTNIKKD